MQCPHWLFCDGGIHLTWTHNKHLFKLIPQFKNKGIRVLREKWKLKLHWRDKVFLVTINRNWKKNLRRIVSLCTLLHRNVWRHIQHQQLWQKEATILSQIVRNLEKSTNWREMQFSPNPWQFLQIKLAEVWSTSLHIELLLFIWYILV